MQVTFTMGRLGYKSMTGFSVGLSVAQISEFSLILVALGVTYGHIPPSTLGVITMVAIITIGASVYLVRYESKIYRFFSKYLLKFQKNDVTKEDFSSAEKDLAEIIVMGLGHYGGRIAKGLALSGVQVTGVDFNPNIAAIGEKDNLHYAFGDLEDPNLVDHLPIDSAVWIVSTVPSLEINLDFLRSIKNTNFTGQFAVLAESQEEAIALKAAGVDLILMPFTDAADQAVDLITGHVRRPFVDGYDFGVVEF